MMGIYKYLKRFLDLVISFFLLVLLFFPMLVIAISIKLIDGGPVLFIQERTGKNEKKFICIKFRTMRCDAPKYCSTENFYNAKDYITHTGAFLRKTSLDELPQLFNVIIGDMSIIGPRPLIANEVLAHELRSKNGVYTVRPGITGLAQICGRDRLSTNRKIECDIIYVNNCSFSLDVRIMIETLVRVSLKDGCTDK